MQTIDELVEAIRAEAKKSAICDLAKTMVEQSADIWLGLKAHCGKHEAALAVMCLLQEAVEDGAICATKFLNEDSMDTTALSISVIDEWCSLIEGGVSLEVVRPNVEANRRGTD